MKFYNIIIICAIAMGAIAGSTLATIGYRNSHSPLPTADILPSPTPTTENPTPPTTVVSPSPSTPPTTEPNLPTTEPTVIKNNQPDKSTFFQFRLRLVDAVNRRDASFIRSLVTPETEWNYGGTLTLDSYNIDDKNSEFWAYMDKAVGLDCAIDNQAKVANKEPGSDVWICPDVKKALESIRPNKPNVGQLAILGQDVNVRSEPGAGGKIVGVVSHEFVAFDGNTFNSLPERRQKAIKEKVVDGWTPVKLQNGQQGWILNRYVYDQETDYRVSFVRTKGQWRLRYFLPGNGN
ncbi:SH3 domain-containing protein [Funiculus sociatus GB2-A5]|uniref:SH3 domain-containing protein n=1 Tax=Funiculus sociatus GB2-A5 TaxID=2933946 RepID=A0ABV0JY16_9CYAN|nr:MULTISPECIES: SH3 domain-containing protein [unclassified Trichocoleus]MBD1908067.1 SH3 domain-containing protein [Trichocoleus sp. FACHB-832]MBD2062070.1 SH3 domain-containing protein [Trichocoleus sp. FACHB-6]